MSHPHRPDRRLAPQPRPSGFTLVEVLVALFILSVVALMAWQGLDALVRTRDGAQARSEQTLQLNNALAQWELDLHQIQHSAVVPVLRFDGSAMRLTRHTPQGLQVVLWTVQDGRWYRWASAPTTRTLALRQAWEASLQWVSVAPQALVMLDDATGWQVFYYQSGDNAWSNALSSGNRRARPVTGATPPPPPASGASAPEADGETPAPVAGEDEDELPAGVRLVLSLPRGDVTRDLQLPPTP